MGRFHSRAVQFSLSLSLLLPQLFPTLALGYTPTFSPQGKQIQWRDQLKLMLAGNPANRNGISAEAFRDAMVRGLQRWKYASSERVDFDYWQGTDASLYPASSDYDGISSVYFASAAKNSPVSGNIIGLTQVWYDTESGKILETDITLNDVNFTLTTNPRDSTSGSGGSRVFIENIITHEIGHAFGLSHSANVQSTMLYVEGPEQAYLSCDEQTGIRGLYGANLEMGTLAGTVTTSSGTAVFGAQVVAISATRGVVLGTTLSKPGGDFSIGGLEPGTYYVMVEPYHASLSSLPGYFTDANSAKVCGGVPFGRTVVSDANGKTQAFSIGVGGAVSTGTIQVSCAGTAAAVPSVPGASDFSTAPTVYTGSGTQFGVADRIAGAASRAYYKVQNVSGNFQAQVLSYSLYSPSRITMRLLDSFGNSVSGTTATSPTYTGVSGYVNYDSRLSAPDLAPGNYVLELTQTELLSPSAYPGGSVARDSVPFFVVTASVNGPGVRSNYPANARCRMDENFPAYSSPEGGPPKNGFTEREADSGAGFCGTVKPPGSSGGGSRRVSTPEIVGWLLPWFLMLGGLRSRRIFSMGLRRFRQASIL